MMTYSVCLPSFLGRSPAAFLVLLPLLRQDVTLVSALHGPVIMDSTLQTPRFGGAIVGNDFAPTLPVQTDLTVSNVKNVVNSSMPAPLLSSVMPPQPLFGTAQSVAVAPAPFRQMTPKQQAFSVSKRGVKPIPAAFTSSAGAVMVAEAGDSSLGSFFGEYRGGPLPKEAQTKYSKVDMKTLIAKASPALSAEVRASAKTLRKVAREIRRKARAEMARLKPLGCLGKTPKALKNTGAGKTCGKHNEKSDWCFVDSHYVGYGHEFKKTSPTSPGWYIAPCSQQTETAILSQKKAAKQMLKRIVVLKLEGRKIQDKADEIDKAWIEKLRQKAIRQFKKAAKLTAKAKITVKNAASLKKVQKQSSCLGWAPNSSGYGKTCGRYDAISDWCFVDKGYVGATKSMVKEHTKYKGKFFAPCNKGDQKIVGEMKKKSGGIGGSARSMKEIAKKATKAAMETKASAVEAKAQLRRRRSPAKGKKKGK
eukprot:TRINITY_DN48707_c0_g1_i1.p1 TRINITY_DN48707_c0_g1~~TRINITY_DN48707_c0_g1_i1.p1  ORF type:complete len:493 (+),score=81.45 TRINITY_DN48707_c0_g1_i1:47-1480(+)